MGRTSHAYAKMTRREALEKLSPAVLLSLGLWPGALGAAESGGSFRFIVVNDLHYMSTECGDFLERMTRQMKSHGDIELCLVAGDLTEKGEREHHGAVRDILRAFGIPTYVVIGNHDYKAGSGERGTYDEMFPQSLNYSFVHRGWQFIGLDTSDGLKFENTQIQPHTLNWTGKLDKKRPTVMFTHFPLGPGVKYRPLNADALLEQYKPFNLQSIFCGHYHASTEAKVGDAIVTTNRCCALKRGNHDGTKEKGYFVCTARDGKITREFVEFPAPKTAATPRRTP